MRRILESDVSDVDLEQLKALTTVPSLSLVLVNDRSVDDRFAYKLFQSTSLRGSQILFEKQPPTSGRRASFLKEIDRALDQGDSRAARAMLYTLEPRLRFASDLIDSFSAIEWYSLGKSVDLTSGSTESRELLAFARTYYDRYFAAAEDVHMVAQLWMRLLYATRSERAQPRFAWESAFVKEMFGAISFEPHVAMPSNANDGGSPKAISEVIVEWDFEKASDETQQTITHEYALGRLTEKAFTSSLLEYPDYEPYTHVVPDFPSPPSFWNAVDDDVVFVRSSRGLYAFNLSTSQPWPDSRNEPLYQTKSSGNPLPLAIADEVQLGALAIAHNACFAVLDTGARSSTASNRLLRTELIGISLTAQGAVLPGFPLRAHVMADESFCFVGTPLVVGENLYVLMVDQLKSQQHFKVAKISALNGHIDWISKEFGAVGHYGSNDNIRSSCMLYDQGRLFVCTGRSSINCLDADTGEPVFQLNYTPQNTRKGRLPTVNHRSSRLHITADLLVCNPCDSADCFALDWGSGAVRWITADGALNVSNTPVGIVEDQIIFVGSRLQWIDVNSGQIVGYKELTNAPKYVAGSATQIDSRIIWNNGQTLYEFPFTPFRSDLPSPQSWPHTFSGPVNFSIDSGAELLAILSNGTVQIFVDATTSNAVTPEQSSDVSE